MHILKSCIIKKKSINFEKNLGIFIKSRFSLRWKTLDKLTSSKQHSKILEFTGTMFFLGVPIKDYIHISFSRQHVAV